MRPERLERLAFAVKHRLIDYLEKTDAVLDDSDTEQVTASCPFCGQEAVVTVIPFAERYSFWTCPNCGRKGDALDYMMEMHHMEKEQAVLELYDKLTLPTHCLQTVSATELMQARFVPLNELVEGILAPGLYILAGAPKIGKSWLVLQLAVCVSMGISIWDRNTRQCDVLYLALEDSQRRLQSRLQMLCQGEIPGNITFATEAEKLGMGLEECVSNHMDDYPQTGLVIVDTLAKIRGRASSQNAYQEDYATMAALKKLADRYGLVLLVVHHTRKLGDADPMNRVSGTNGLTGSADGSLVMEKPDRQQPVAYLNITGRDVEDARLELHQNQENMHWEFMGFAEDAPEQASEPLFEALCGLVYRESTWTGTAGQLLAELQQLDPTLQIKSNALSRSLNDNQRALADLYGITMTRKRQDNQKLLVLTARDGMSDVSD